MLLSATPRTDNLKAAVVFKLRLEMFLQEARKKLGYPLPYEVQIAWVKVFYDTAKTKVYCFVDIDTGGVHRKNNETAAIPTSRGNIYDEDLGVTCLEQDGPKKLQDGCPKGRPSARKGRKFPKRNKAEPVYVHPTLIRVPK